MKKEPKSEKPSFFKELGEYIRPYRGQFALSIIVSLLAVFCGLAVYGVVGVLCGEIFEGDRSFVQLLLIIGVAGLCKILNAVFLMISATSVIFASGAFANAARTTPGPLTPTLIMQSGSPTP